jgi:hypothetical protein
MGLSQIGQDALVRRTAADIACGFGDAVDPRPSGDR